MECIPGGGYGVRQWPSRYTTHTGQYLPGKECCYLRTLVLVYTYGHPSHTSPPLPAPHPRVYRCSSRDTSFPAGHYGDALVREYPEAPRPGGLGAVGGTWNRYRDTGPRVGSYPVTPWYHTYTYTGTPVRTAPSTGPLTLGILYGRPPGDVTLLPRVCMYTTSWGPYYQSPYYYPYWGGLYARVPGGVHRYRGTSPYLHLNPVR